MILELVTLVFSAAVVQAPPKVDESIVVTGELPDDKKRVCKQVEEIGSILPRRICRTKGEWTSLARGVEQRTDAYVNDKNTMSSRVKRPGAL